jgi:hypothetical protein
VGLDALWTAEFQVVGGWTNGGVVILEKGRLFGGDGQYYYVGRLSLSPHDGTSLSGHLKVVHYHGERTTAFGDAGPVFNLEIQATMLSPTAISGVLKRPGFPTLAFRLVRREELS